MTATSATLVPDVARAQAVLRGASDEATRWLDKLTKQPPAQSTVRQIVGQYYFVNRAFVLGIIQYAGRLAGALEGGHGDTTSMKPHEIEDVLATVAKICSDECQAGGVYAGKHMHHNLLLRMGPKVGLQPSEISNVKPSRATAALCKLIDSQFRAKDLFLGLSMVSAVESIALPMVKALRAYFGDYCPHEGGLGFSAYELEHLDLHIELEVHHAAESSEIYEHVALDAQTVEKLTKTAGNLVARFDSFWKQFT